MKRILFLIAIVGLSVASKAQTTSTPAIDTLTASSSTDTVNLLSPAKYFNGNNGIYSVGFIATKISGTVNGYAILQSSIDGTNYTNHYGTSADTFTLANVSTVQAKNWFVTGAKPNKVRIRVLAPSSTQAVQVKGYFIKN